MKARPYIPLPERLAAALACLLDQETRDRLRRSKVSAAVVVGMFELDHIELYALSDPNLPDWESGRTAWFNLDHKLKAVHHEKSRRDTAIAAKVKRLQKKEEIRMAEHKYAMTGQLPVEPQKKTQPKHKWANRPWPKQKRKMR